MIKYERELLLFHNDEKTLEYLNIQYIYLTHICIKFI